MAVVRLDLAGWTSSLVSHPDLVEEALVHQHKNFVKHSFFWRHVTRMFGQGLLTSEGEVWRRQLQGFMDRQAGDYAPAAAPIRMATAP